MGETLALVFPVAGGRHSHTEFDGVVSVFTLLPPSLTLDVVSSSLLLLVSILVAEIRPGSSLV